jgi:hypothetical protein
MEWFNKGGKKNKVSKWKKLPLYTLVPHATLPFTYHILPFVVLYFPEVLSRDKRTYCPGKRAREPRPAASHKVISTTPT